MRKGHFSEQQMVAIIRETDREPAPAVAERHEISEHTISTWRKRPGGGRRAAAEATRGRECAAEEGSTKNAAPRQATGQGDAVCGPPRPGPLHHPFRKEHMQ
jgi:putative transposase